MLNIRPVKLLPVREQAASSLREAIINQNIQPGEILPLEATAKALGISVTPVREAFQILARDGLIELAQNRGAVVLGMTRKNIREHYEIRAVLEAKACQLVCLNNADLEDIRINVVSARNALLRGDHEGYSEYNQSFHFHIWTASGNSKLLNMLSELWNGLSMGLKTTRSEYAEKSQREHEAIFQKLEARDAQGAFEAMDLHITRSMNDILTRYKY